MLPSWRDWIFSAKTFAGAMLALWIALRIGLDRPYWAMATAYIVAHPLTGAMRSKSAYRFYGTLVGAVACLALIPNLVDAPVLLIAALSVGQQPASLSTLQAKLSSGVSGRVEFCGTISNLLPKAAGQTEKDVIPACRRPASPGRIVTAR